MNNLDKAYEIVRQGPCLPVEVASKLGVDSFLANAYLSQLIDANKIKASKERVGNAFVYFLPGHEGAANSRVQALLQPTQKTARMFASSVPAGAEVEQKRQAFAERLQEIEKKEAIQKAQPKQEVKPISIAEKVKQEFLDRFRPAIAEQLARQEAKPAPVLVQPATKMHEDRKIAEQMMQEVEKKVKETKEIKIDSSKLVDKALAFLADGHADIISKDLKKKGKEADIIAHIPSPIGNLKYLVVVRDKKTVSEADLSLAFTEGQSKKMPVLFVTNGKLTKTAENYLSLISGLVKFKNL